MVHVSKTRLFRPRALLAGKYAAAFAKRAFRKGTKRGQKCQCTNCRKTFSLRLFPHGFFSGSSLFSLPAERGRRLPESLVERRVEYWVCDGGDHPEGEGERVADVEERLSAREELLAEEVEDDAVEHERGPAEEEDGRDEGKEDVGAAAPPVHRRVLAGRPVGNRHGTLNRSRERGRESFKFLAPLGTQLSAKKEKEERKQSWFLVLRTVANRPSPPPLCLFFEDVFCSTVQNSAEERP